MKIGTKLYSQACDGEVIVIRANGIDGAPPEAGGVPLASERGAERHGDADGDGFPLGKRYEYADPEAGVRIELLVTAAGTSTLSWQGHPLTVKATRPLPSSD
ncbi:MAG: hypothetical protein WA971_09995 [Microbacterium sp.]